MALPLTQSTQLGPLLNDYEGCQLRIYTQNSQPTKYKGTPSPQLPGTKVNMAGSEPLFQEADPYITKLTVELRCRIKKVQIKRIDRTISLQL